MELAHRVALNGVQLDSLDDRILITAVDEAAGKDTITAVSLGAGNGQRINGKRRDTLDLTVKFALRIRNNDMAGRSELLDLVNAWAFPGGLLTLGNRVEKHLQVVLAQAPGGGDQYKWTNEYTMVFRAYGIPFWEDEDATSVTLEQDDAGGGTITVPGSAETVGEIRVQNKSGSTLDGLSVTINGYTMSFSDLGLANNGFLRVDHVLAGGVNVMRARIGSTSVMTKRSGADEFVMVPGVNAIGYAADGEVILQVSVRGRYL